MRIFLLLLLKKCKPHLGPSSSQDETSVLAGLGFSPSSDEFKILELVYVGNVCVSRKENPSHLLSKSQTKNPVCHQHFLEGGGEGVGLLLYKGLC